MPLLFCYGSNNPSQLAERIGRPRSMEAAYAPKHKRVFRGWSHNWGGGVASLASSTKRPAYGYVADVTAAQLREMDRYEGVGYGNYERRNIDVVVDGRKKKAVAYVSLSKEFNQPSEAYLEAVARTIGAFWEIEGPEDIVVE